MIFTREDILKILNALLQLGRKDSEFKDANTPLNSEDYIAIVLNGINKKVSINNLLSTLGLLKKDDFINVSDRYDEYYIQLSEAITIIANNKRKKGLVITFLDTNGAWKIYQFNNEIPNFIKTEYWKDLFDFKYPIINTILPDEEDLTLTYPNTEGNSFIKLKDKEYDSENFSGMATKILRKNIKEVDGIKKNLLTLNDFNKENCIYEIKYDFDLNNLTINIPNNCILKFNGGKLHNGYIKGSLLNKVLYLEDFDIEDIGIFFSNYKPIDNQKIILEKKVYTTSKKIVINNKYIEIDGNNSTIISNIEKDGININADISISTGINYLFSNLSFTSTDNYNFSIIVSPEIIKNIEEGDIIKIRTSNVYLTNYYPESLYSVVKEVDILNNIILINDKYEYNSIYEINIIKPCNVKIYNFTYVSKGPYNTAINCNGVINSLFDNITLIGNGAVIGLQVSGINTVIRKCHIKDFTDLNRSERDFILGYGINITGNNNIVEQNIISNCKHNITSAERAYLSKNIVINNNNTSTNANNSNIYSASIDVHGCCQAIITNNIINTVDAAIFLIRSNNTVFSNNTINSENRTGKLLAIAQIYELADNLTIANNTINIIEGVSVSFIKISLSSSNNKNISLYNNTFNNTYFRIGELSNCNININQNIINCRRYKFIDGEKDLSNNVMININNNLITNSKALYGGRNLNKIKSIYIKNNIFKENITFLEDDFEEEVEYLIILNNTFQNNYTFPINSRCLFYNNNNNNNIINKVGLNADINNQPNGDYYIDTKFKKPYFKNSDGTYRDSEGINYGIYKRGNTNNRPTTEQGANGGFLYYDTDLGRYVVKKLQSSDYYTDILGNTAGIKYKGTFAERPLVTSTKFLQDNFIYFCTDLASPETGKIGIPIFYKQKGDTADAIWVDSQGREVTSIYPKPYNNNGKFNSKPSDPPLGFAYYCTDKQTTEGSTDGIMIYHKGDNIWVDALGRIIN